MNKEDLKIYLNTITDLQREVIKLEEENNKLRGTLDNIEYLITEGREYNREDYTDFENQILDMINEERGEE